MDIDLNKHYELLQLLFDTLPFVFWKDRDGIYRGGNLNQAKAFGFKSPDDFIGKNIYEIVNDKSRATLIDNVDNKIMNTGISQVLEEAFDTPFGEKIYLTQKHPIKDGNEQVIGLLGFAMDVTEIRMQEHVAKKERDKFKRLVNQISHDICSPLVSLKMQLEKLTLSENEKMRLQQEGDKIWNIANHLLSIKPSQTEDEEQPLALLVKPAIEAILTSKGYEYKRDRIKFDFDTVKSDKCRFINMQPIAFDRMLSNLINNAVEALEGTHNRNIDIQLWTNNNHVCISIEDYGKGIPPEILEKLKANFSVTSGKTLGHGIGFGQITDTVNNNHGKIDIESILGYGTKVILKFPEILAPDWFTDTINITNTSRIIIVDDDESIHDIWENTLKEIIEQNPRIDLKHFFSGIDALDFIKTLTTEDKANTILLSDYQLRRQRFNGLEIAIESQIKNTFIVTAFYNNFELQNSVSQNQFKILPKPFMPDIRFIQ